MTIVVYNKGTLAADRSASVVDLHVYETCKIVRGQWTIGAGAGSVMAIKAFNEWVEHDMQAPLGSTGEGMIGIAVSKEGVFLASDGVVVQIPADHPYAIGRGSEVALGAVDFGADAATAALIAARRMGCAQYGIDVCSLDTPITRIFAPKGKLNVNTF